MKSKILPELIKYVSKITNYEEKVEEKQPITCDLNTAIVKMKEVLSKAQNEYWTETISEASKGELDKIKECYDIIEFILEEEKISVEGMDTYNAAKEIFRKEYGLGELEVFIKDDKVDEVRVSPTGRVHLTTRGKNVRTDIVLDKKEIERLLMVLKPYTDTGASLDESNPTLELVREDKTRLTALSMPVVSGQAFVLRKSDNIKLSGESLIELKTMDAKTWRIISLITRGRANQLIYGDVGTGKSTLLKLMVGQIPDNINISVIDMDTELKLAEAYPHKEIWEIEVHDEVGATIDSLFTTVLRISPDIVIVPEFRGKGEASIVIESCIRGHRGLITTCHYSADLDPESIINNIAFLMKKEGMEAPVELLEQRTAKAIDILIRMEADKLTGVRRITKIVEVYTDEKNNIKHNTLVEWQAKDNNYWGEGSWEIINKPSEKLINIMLKSNVTREEIEEAFS